MTVRDFDILIVGGGHAGTEAACVASRMGMKVGLITMDKTKMALMSCNPAVGGVGKGHLVREVDILGGIIGRAADYAGIQFRRLNLSKGPAVRSTRVQCDRKKYCEYVTSIVSSLPGVAVIEGEAAELITEREVVTGVRLKEGSTLSGSAVIIASGTFLGGLIHIGLKKIPAGRRGEPPANCLTESLRNIGFEIGRLKTGTPPRVDGKTIDRDRMEMQPGHEPPPCFSHFYTEIPAVDNSGLCYLTYTTPETANLIRENLHQAPLFTGQIKGVGPRYCPSIEDKIVRFADKPRHQIFIEPEGKDTDEIYLNGFATSIPEDIQIKAVRTIVGMEEAVINHFGYAIEYDFVPPYQIRPTLETKRIAGLFLAGQINGTSGYEEAAAQGLVAGLNASLYIRKEPLFLPRRHEAYIGVMLDDLTSRNITEPYRMFTSRAEYRLALREDNALERLSDYGKQYDLYADKEKAIVEIHKKNFTDAVAYLKKNRINQSTVKSLFGLSTKRGSLALADLVCRPELDSDKLFDFIKDKWSFGKDIFDKAAIVIKYKGYLEKQEREIHHNSRQEMMNIPQNVNYEFFSGLKKEAVEKLKRFQPQTIGQAGRIEGITPSDIAVLTIHLKRKAL